MKVPDFGLELHFVALQGTKLRRSARSYCVLLLVAYHAKRPAVNWQLLATQNNKSACMH